MNRRRRRPQRPSRGAPERFEGVVRDLSSQGHGVVQAPSGQVCFVPGVWPGEEGEFVITAQRGSVAQGRLVELHKPAAARREAPCRHHGVGEGFCGGCAWQFVNYEAQLEAKARRIRQSLEPLCGNDLPLAPIWPSVQVFGYRNRAQFKSDGEQLGYLSQGSHRIVDVHHCPILNEANGKQLKNLRAMLPNSAWRPQRGQKFVSLHTDDDSDAHTLQVDTRRPFRQGNSGQNRRLRDWLAAQLPGETGRPTIELYAGSGNLTEILADRGCSPITAIDSFAPAVEALARRQLPAVDALCIDLERSQSAEAMDPRLRRALKQAELLVLDPPRSGAPELRHLLDGARRLRDVIYVSCDLATYARDLKTLQEAGFTPTTVQPLDMFPHTPHIELLTRLSR